MNTPPCDISPPELARLAVEQFIGGGEVIRPPTGLQGALAGRAGVFVSLHTKDGRLRGCIGTIDSAQATVAEEIICNALNAATCDPRFPPVTPPELTYGVDVLSPLERARGPEDLDPSRYGVLIEAEDGGRRGLLLPRIEGIETVEEQWRIVHQKAGIRLNEPVRVQRFTVTRFGKD